jgi:hypothetical protein
VLAVFKSGTVLVPREVQALLFKAGNDMPGTTLRQTLSDLARWDRLLRVSHGAYALPGYTGPAANLTGWILRMAAEQTRNQTAGTFRAVNAQSLRQDYRDRVGYPPQEHVFRAELEKLAAEKRLTEWGRGTFTFAPDPLGLYD